VPGRNRPCPEAPDAPPELLDLQEEPCGFGEGTLTGADVGAASSAVTRGLAASRAPHDRQNRAASRTLCPQELQFAILIPPWVPSLPWCLKSYRHECLPTTTADNK
jgi:hypothetical protein